MDVEGIHRPAAALRHLGVAGGRDFIQTVCPVHHPGTLGAKERERTRNQFGELRARYADELSRGTGWIGERTEQVERCADPQLAPGWCRVPHGRMERRCEEERD